MESPSVGRLIGTRSLTKDVLFFLTFIFQVVVLFVFFWQKRQNVRRFFLGENSSEDTENENEEGQQENEAQQESQQSHSTSSASDSIPDTQTKPTIEKETTSLLGKDKEKSPEEQELDAEFQPIASTILELKKKIKGLEGTLARRKGHYGTDSLKIRLHECISEISSTLSEMGSIHSEAGTDAAIIAAASNVSPNTSKIDILNWDKPDMRQNLSWIEEKRRELEAAALLAAQQASTAPEAAKTHETVGKQLSPRQDLEEAPQRSDETSRVAPQPVSDVASDEGSESESDGDKSDSEEHSDSEEKTSSDSPADTAPAAANETAADDDDGFDAAALQEQLMGMMNKKGGAGKMRVKGGMAGMFDFNAADIPDFAPEPAAPAQPASGKADLFSLFGGPSTKKDDPAPVQSDSEDEDDLAAALAKKLGGLGDSDSKKSSSEDEEDKSSEEAESENDEKDDLLASLNALSGGNEDDAKESDNEEEDSSENASNDGDKDDLLASLNALGGGNDEDAAKNDLLASLNALSFGGDAEHESGSDNESQEGSEAAESDVEDDAASDHDEESSDSALLKQFGSHGDINVNGLKRAKKTVQMKGIKGGASYQMEDVWICIHPYEGSNDRALFCVFDGHAGKDAAAAASEKFPPIFANLVDDAVTDDDSPTFAEELKKAFLQTDEEMKDYEYEGTTATTVYLWRQGGSRFVQSANVGDSSSVLVKDGVATMISVDHRPTSPAEVERIKAMGIPMNPGQTRLNGLAVSRALGDHFPKSVECGIVAEPYVSPAFKLESTHSHLIVASDGVWDVVSPQRAYDLIKDEEDADKAAQTLIKTVTKSAKCTDNVSCIVVRL
eukprot:TRINITY_DN3894_c0_g1_i1.p1 TRINITY_DN3894_c0_g1~~TRINITY_DN3894_c0_g1_i1.p1  ORF type:complete len:842 (+),score=292.02 TRINITY_DN3894_c0_g1_i1:137-2662(+)